MYLIPNDVELKEAKAVTYGESLAVRFTNRDDRGTAKVVETPEQKGDDLESEEIADVSEMRNYFICSAISEE